jgi:hypothetical protein
MQEFFEWAQEPAADAKKSINISIQKFKTLFFKKKKKGIRELESEEIGLTSLRLSLSLNKLYSFPRLDSFLILNALAVDSLTTHSFIVDEPERLTMCLGREGKKKKSESQEGDKLNWKKIV